MSGLVDEVYPVDPQEKKNQPVWECLAYKYWTVIANKVPGFSQCSGQSHGVGVAKNDKVEWLLYCLRVSADQMLLLLTAQQALGSKDVMEKDCFNGMTVIIKKFGVYVWANKIEKNIGSTCLQYIHSSPYFLSLKHCKEIKIPIDLPKN